MERKKSVVLWVLTVAGLALALGTALWVVQGPQRHGTANGSPLLKPSQLRAYELETVAVRVRLKSLEIDRAGVAPYRVTAHVAFEDDNTGIVTLPDMTDAEFARYTSEFPTGRWYVARGPLSSGKPPYVLGGTLSRE